MTEDVPGVGPVERTMDVLAPYDAHGATALVAVMLVERSPMTADELHRLLPVSMGSIRRATVFLRERDLVDTEVRPQSGRGMNPTVYYPAGALVPNDTDDGDKTADEVVRALAECHYRKRLSSRTASQLADQTGYSSSEVAAALSMLEDEGAVEKTNPESTYRERWALIGSDRFGPNSRGDNDGEK